MCGLPKTLRRIILKVLFLVGLRRLMRHVQRQRVAILMYHGFRNERGCREWENKDGNHLHIDKFSRQIGYLVRHHHVISLHELVDAMCAGKELPDHTVVLTMDDGYRSDYRLAFPILKQHAVNATIFLTTAFVDSKEPLWADRVEWLFGHAKPAVYDVALDGPPLRLALRNERERREAFDAVVQMLKSIPQEKRDDAVEALADRLLPDQAPFVGNHIHSHVILSRADARRQRGEIQTAHDIIEKRTGVRCDLFCYPNGLAGDFDAETQRFLRDRGYRCALTAIPGFNDRSSNVFELRRFTVRDDATFDEFLLSLYGGIRGLVSKTQHAAATRSEGV
jgi:peptidoglycan/xylan/chitin deacetylase (PgdA/CDA1 family)